MLTNLQLFYQIGFHGGRSLSLEIKQHDTILFMASNLCAHELNLTCAINLPTCITFLISGRLPDDTILDDQGRIIGDQFIDLRKISLDGFDIDTWRIPSSHLWYTTQDVVTNHGFWNRNGRANLVIDEEDPLVWILNHRSIVGVEG